MNFTDIAPEAEVDASAARPRILVVDDEKPMQTLATSIMDHLGYDAVAVSTGEDAVEVFREASQSGNGFAAVVMDLALPGGMSGLEATLAIKQIVPDAKVVVSSGYLEQNARSAALEHGFSGILPKPYTAERFASELRFVLKSAQVV